MRISLEKATLRGDEAIRTPIGDVKLVDNYFDDDAATRLFDEMDYQRASQAYLEHATGEHNNVT